MMADPVKPTPSLTHEAHEAAWSALAPRFHQPGFPWRQIVGFVVALLLTLGAYALVTHPHPGLSTATITAILLGLAALQAAVQLGLFLHLRESVGPAWQILTLSLGIAIALGIVGFSIWIVSFHFGAS